MTNLQQMKRQWKPFISSKTLKMDIIQKKILILSRLLQTDIWEATCNVRKPMKLEIRQTFEMFFPIQRRARVSLKWTTMTRSLTSSYERDNNVEKFKEINHQIDHHNSIMYQYLCTAVFLWKSSISQVSFSHSLILNWYNFRFDYISVQQQAGKYCYYVRSRVKCITHKSRSINSLHFGKTYMFNKIRHTHK